jgi:alginate O-acetyltransferase complex protein AlgI
MVFNSLDFAIFFGIFLGGYLALRSRFNAQSIWLLAASYIFYAWWNWRYLALVILCALVDYFVSQLLVRAPTPRQRRLSLMTSLSFSISVLFYFKYLNFFAASYNQTVGAWTNYLVPALNIVLPVGISFFTFQSMAYIIDVYRGKAAPARRLLDYLLFVSFFPQMVAGPIERPGHLLVQLSVPRDLNADMAFRGLMQMMWGLFQKVAVADNLAVYVDAVYSNHARHSGISLLAATYLFAFQIYCDFAGYSNMAIGMARIMGFNLVENFRTPYFAQNIQEFWHRWHISLSTWFRDYLYFPLGGSRGPAWRVVLNILIVFVVSGLWHGAAWKFVVWGGLHGLYLVVYRFFTNDKPSSVVRRFVNTLFTFNLVCIAWTFFRADNVHTAVQMLRGMVNPTGSFFFDPVLLPGGLCLLAMLLIEKRAQLLQVHEWLSASASRAACGLIGSTLALLLFGSKVGAVFIYFQF